MINCYLCFSEDSYRRSVTFDSTLSSSRTVADVVREYFPAIPQNFADKPSVCSKCFTTMKQFSELVDTVQITHSYPKIQLVKCEAFDLPIKTEPEPFEIVSVLGSQSEIQGEEVAEDELRVLFKKEQDEQEQPQQKAPVKVLNGSNFHQLYIETGIKVASERKKVGQHFAIPVPRLLKRPRFPAREEEKDEDNQLAKHHQKSLPTATKQPKIINFTSPELRNLTRKAVVPFIVERGLSSLPKVVEKLDDQVVTITAVTPAVSKPAPSLPPPTLLVRKSPPKFQFRKPPPKSQIRKAPPKPQSKKAPPKSQVKEKQIKIPDEASIEDIEIKCYVCQTKLPTFGELMEHFSLYHPDHSAYFMCCYAMIIKQKQFVEHIEAFHKAGGPEVQCSICKEMFKTRAQLFLHGLQHNKFRTPKDDREVLSFQPIETYTQDGFRMGTKWSTAPAHECFECKARFETIDQLINHFQATHPKSIEFFTCCNQNILGLDQFSRHLRNASRHLIREGSVIQCQRCCETFRTSSDLYEHCLENYAQYKCTCGAKFKEKDAIEHHLMLHIYQHRQFECFKCQHACKGYEKLKSHIDASHPVKQKQLQNEVQTRSVELKECDRCGFTGQRIDRHMKKHVDEDRIKRGEGVTCPKCKKAFASQSSFNAHYNNKHAQSLCTICSKFILKRHWTEHMFTHKENDRVKCPHCDSYLKHELGLKLHIRYQHSQDSNKEFQCDKCGKVHKSKNYLWQHMQNVHSKRNLPCRFCPKRWKTSSSLKEHEATHTHFHSFICEWCPQSFRSESQYRQHRKQAHMSDLKNIKEELRPD